jgi:aspartate/methionine/tyrosine aminotransferase
MNHPEISKMFPNDAIKRAKFMLEKIPGGIGAYSHSQGFPFVRQMISEFITRRDGYPSDPDTVSYWINLIQSSRVTDLQYCIGDNVVAVMITIQIFMYNGASPGIQHVLRLLIRDQNDAVQPLIIFLKSYRF